MNLRTISIAEYDMRHCTPMLQRLIGYLGRICSPKAPRRSCTVGGNAIDVSLPKTELDVELGISRA